MMSNFLFWTSLSVQDKISKLLRPRPERCLKCNRENCAFADCSEHNNFMCLEVFIKLWFTVSQYNVLFAIDL